MVGLTIAGLLTTAILSGANPDTELAFYPKSGIVVEVNYEADVVTVEDTMGHYWTFEGTEDWLENDICSMIMCDAGTPMNIIDDIICGVTYEGVI